MCAFARAYAVVLEEANLALDLLTARLVEDALAKALGAQPAARGPTGRLLPR